MGLYVLPSHKRCSQTFQERTYPEENFLHRYFPQTLVYKKATLDDIETLTQTRIEVLRAANKLSEDVDMEGVKKNFLEYYEYVYQP